MGVAQRAAAGVRGPPALAGDAVPRRVPGSTRGPPALARRPRERCASSSTARASRCSRTTARRSSPSASTPRGRSTAWRSWARDRRCPGRSDCTSCGRCGDELRARTALRGRRGRGNEVRLRRGHGPGRRARRGAAGHHQPRADHRPGRRVLPRRAGASRAPGRDRHRLVRSRRPRARVAHLRLHHLDAQARLEERRPRGAVSPRAGAPGGVRHGRERGRPRRVALGRGAGAGHLRLPDRSAPGSGEAASWAAG